MFKPDASHVPYAALTGSMRDFRVPTGADLLTRTEGFYRWQDLRRQNGLWPFSRSTETGPGAVVSARDDRNIAMRGVNFASQDYLSMSSHPVIKATARKPSTLWRSQRRLAGACGQYQPFGRARGEDRRVPGYGRGAALSDRLGGRFRRHQGSSDAADHIVMDTLAHTCLQEGANAATRNIYQFRHLDLAHCRNWLAQIRAKDSENGILVVTEGLFSMDSDTPDIAAMQELCREFNATLLVDVAHDLGCLGEDGRGHIGMQNMLGKVDLVMGSSPRPSPRMAVSSPATSGPIKEYLRFYSAPATFSNALSPVQAAVVLKAFEIIDSAEGRALRCA